MTLPGIWATLTTVTTKHTKAWVTTFFPSVQLVNDGSKAAASAFYLLAAAFRPIQTKSDMRVSGQSGRPDRRQDSKIKASHDCAWCAGLYDEFIAQIRSAMSIGISSIWVW